MLVLRLLGRFFGHSVRLAQEANKLRLRLLFFLWFADFLRRLLLLSEAEETREPKGHSLLSTSQREQPDAEYTVEEPRDRHQQETHELYRDAKVLR